MSKKFIQHGKTIEVTAAAAISSGDFGLIGSLAGVAQIDAAIGETAVYEVEGVHEVPAATAAITQGAKVYWDADGDPYGGVAGTGAATATATDNTAIGIAWEAKAGSVGTVKVKLNVAT